MARCPAVVVRRRDVDGKASPPDRASRGFCGRRGLPNWCLALLLAAAGMACAHTAWSHDDAAPAKVRASLIDLWLAFPDVDSVAWPYSYIRATDTAARQRSRMKVLFTELDALDWRLDNDHYPAYRAAIRAWRLALDAIPASRLPGQWSPAWLMDHPYQHPPIAKLAALGACAVPERVQVWDSKGVTRIPWQPGLMLSDVTRDRHRVDAGRSDEVAVVAPDGRIDHYGVAAWNYADTRLQPGARVVAALPLAGEGLLWIRDAIARVLAHAVPGAQCRERAIVVDAKQADPKQ